jgi:hypothetical protein
LRQLVVVEEIPSRVRDDEFVLVLAVANGICCFVFVLDKPDDFEFDRSSISRFYRERFM